LAYKSEVARQKKPAILEPLLRQAEQDAAKMIPSRVMTPAAPLAGAAPPQLVSPTLTGYYTQEARNFADGQRSVLDIRNAISAEFGPVPVETVVNFFRNGERQGQYTIVVK
jgi:hypothetical protein